MDLIRIVRSYKLDIQCTIEEPHLLLDLLILEYNKFIRLVAAAVQISKNLQCLGFFPMINQPPRAFWEYHHAKRQNDRWNHLKSPRNPERGDAIDVRAAELDEVLDKDTPCDGPAFRLIFASNVQERTEKAPLLK